MCEQVWWGRKSKRTNRSCILTNFIVSALLIQMIGHMPHRPEPKNQGLIIPKSLLFNFCSETLATKPHYTSSSNSTEEQHLVNPGSNKTL